MQQAGKRIAPRIYYQYNNQNIEILYNDIKLAKPFFNAKLIGTVMRGLKLETTKEIPNVPIYFENKASYDTDSAIKTIGPYFLKEKPEYNADTKTYSCTLYDNFIKAMVDYKPITINYPCTVLDFFKRLCVECGFTTDITSLPNGNRTLVSDVYKDVGFTYRDVFEDIGQATATLFILSGINVEKCILGNNSTTIDDDILKNQNISLGEHFGPINSIILSRSADSDSIYKRNESLDSWNEYKISDNILMNGNDRVDYISEIYNALYGVQYDIFDLELVGFGGFEPLQGIEIETDDKVYNSYVFNNEEEFTQGYKENIFTDMPEESKQDYSISDTTDRRIRETYLIVDKQNQKIEAAVTNSEEALNQTTNLSIELGKIQTHIKEVAKLTDSAEKTGIVELNNVNESEPVELEIYPTTEDIYYTYLKNTLRLSNTAFLRGRTVVFENITTNEKIEYELPSDLRFLGNEHDTFTLNLNQHICTVIKRIGVNSSGEKYLLETPSTKTFTYPTINLTNGDYKIYVKSCKNTAHIKCALMTQNVYTDQFYTKVEAESKFTQTIDSITLEVNKKLENYSTTNEMNSAIILKANEISQSVASTYATKNQLNSAKSEIKQTTDSITSVVNTKVSTSDLNNTLKNYSTTTQMNSAITQKANSITQSVNAQITTVNNEIKSVKGTVELKLDTKDLFSEFNVAVNKVMITSDNFKLDAKGNMKASNVDLTGKITASSGKIGGASIDGNSLFYNNGSTGWGLHGTTNHANIAFHVGANSTNIGGAPLRILHDGSVYTSKLFVEGGQIQIIQSDENRKTPIILSQQYNGSTYKGQMGGAGTSFYKNEVQGIQIAIGTTSGNGTIYLYNTSNTNEYNYVTPAGIRTTSDIRFKDNINNISEEISLNIITNLNPITYTYKNGDDYHRGLSAQEVEQVLLKNNITNQIFSCEYDEVNGDERYSLNYTELIPDLINVCKYLTKQVKDLKLERRLSNE